MTFLKGEFATNELVSYHLDWSTIPYSPYVIHSPTTKTYAAECIKSKYADDISRFSKRKRYLFEPIFKNVPGLLIIQYVINSTGIFIFRLKFSSDLTQEERDEAEFRAKQDVTDAIKNRYCPTHPIRLSHLSHPIESLGTQTVDLDKSSLPVDVEFDHWLREENSQKISEILSLPEHPDADQIQALATLRRNFSKFRNIVLGDVEALKQDSLYRLAIPVYVMLAPASFFSSLAVDPAVKYIKNLHATLMSSIQHETISFLHLLDVIVETTVKSYLVLFLFGIIGIVIFRIRSHLPGAVKGVLDSAVNTIREATGNLRDFATDHISPSIVYVFALFLTWYILSSISVEGVPLEESIRRYSKDNFYTIATSLGILYFLSSIYEINYKRNRIINSLHEMRYYMTFSSVYSSVILSYYCTRAKSSNVVDDFDSSVDVITRRIEYEESRLERAKYILKNIGFILAFVITLARFQLLKY